MVPTAVQSAEIEEIEEIKIVKCKLNLSQCLGDELNKPPH
jgi:hypothetical protein